MRSKRNMGHTSAHNATDTQAMLSFHHIGNTPIGRHNVMMGIIAIVPTMHAMIPRLLHDPKNFISMRP